MRPKARDIEDVLLLVVDGLVRSYSDQSRYGFASCDGIEQVVWFAAAFVEGLKPQ